ncbi:MAG: chemotaxis protein CheX [Spirochaetia bacterium]|nr:chemotaxis protein CheX [Spirochaetia bacterium]
MKAELVSPFLESAVSVFRSLLKLELLRGKMTLRDTPAPTHDVAIVIDVKGSVKGRVVYSLNIETAYRLTKILLPKVGENELILEYRDVIGEMANVMTGNAMSAFLKRGTELDMSTPLVIDTRMKQHRFDSGRTISLNLYSKVGMLEVNISLE